MKLKTRDRKRDRKLSKRGSYRSKDQWYSCKKKQRYKHFYDAQKAAKNRSRDGAGHLRVYGCEMCRGFHLTARVRLDRTHADETTGGEHDQITGDFREESGSVGDAPNGGGQENMP